MNIPDTWNTLSDFTKWYVDNNYPILVPDNVQVFPTDVSYSVCVFRRDVYQVELYIAKPEFMSSLPPNHWHQVGSGMQGFVFYNCQKWPNVELMTSAVVEYGGESLGPLHKQIIK